VSDIGIIDYGMGNLGSVTNACRFLELPFRVIAKPDELEACGAVILPGVGAFGDCMRHLEEHGFVAPIRDWIAADRPFLGICLGLQVLFEGSEESPDVPGLGVLPGTIYTLGMGNPASAASFSTIKYNRELSSRTTSLAAYLFNTMVSLNQ